MIQIKLRLTETFDPEDLTRAAFFEPGFVRELSGLKEAEMAKKRFRPDQMVTLMLRTGVHIGNVGIKPYGHEIFL